MRILADENVAGSVVRALTDGGHAVKWVTEVASGSTDRQILEMAIAEKRLLLTHDKEFAGMARQALPDLTGLVLLRLDRIKADAVAGFVVKTLNSRDDWTGQFAVVKRNSIRFHRALASNKKGPRG